MKYKDAKGRAVFKFNGGLGALLCSKCAIIIKYGKDFSVNEMLAMQGKVKLEEQYCEKCKKEL